MSTLPEQEAEVEAEAIFVGTKVMVLLQPGLDRNQRRGRHQETLALARIIVNQDVAVHGPVAAYLFLHTTVQDLSLLFSFHVRMRRMRMVELKKSTLGDKTLHTLPLPDQNMARPRVYLVGPLARQH